MTPEAVYLKGRSKTMRTSRSKKDWASWVQQQTVIGRTFPDASLCVWLDSIRQESSGKAEARILFDIFLCLESNDEDDDRPCCGDVLVVDPSRGAIRLWTTADKKSYCIVANYDILLRIPGTTEMIESVTEAKKRVESEDDEEELW